eukprot:CAMPEP_0114982974 /NCGR_PEP_ID=MMETSP0216-20121206/6433_1 /TAXON_ID=223996 /ORGANISM="Protocruzia adherens, Strain Boccale" /LENGTH=858 /DNA_ID=CAMNT_0002344887 /DNA_START=463 /DNA_END=3039 /DNA_ORIENTATION=-
MTQPDIFGIEQPEQIKMQFVDIILKAKFLDMCPFFKQVLPRLREDYGLDEFMHPLFENLQEKASKLNLGQSDEILQCLEAIKSLTRCPDLAKSFCSIPSMNPVELTGLQIETQTVLGPFLAISCFGFESAYIREQFGNANRQKPAESEHKKQKLRDICHKVQDMLADIFYQLFEAGGETKECALAYIATAINKNRCKAQMMNQNADCSGNGFMCNMLQILLRLCSRYMNLSEKSLAEMEAINSAYCVNGRIAWDQVSRLDGDYNKEKFQQGQDHNLMTELFFLTLECSYIALKGPHTKYSELLIEIKRENDRPVQITQNLALLKCRKVADECQLLDSDMVRRVIAFFTYSSVYFLMMIKRSQIESRKEVFDIKKYQTYRDMTQTFEYPLEMELNDHLKVLPEHVVEVIYDHILFYLQYADLTNIFDDHCSPMFMIYFLTLMDSPSILRNPHLRVRKIDLFYFVISTKNKEADHFRRVFQSCKVIGKFFMHALIRLYNDVEKTGSTNQFYEKFAHRFKINQLFDHLWTKRDTYQPSVSRCSSMFKKKFQAYLSFVLNDMIYLLDEALTNIQFVKTYHEMEANPTRMQGMSQIERVNLLNDYSRKKKILKSILKYIIANARIMCNISSKVKDPFNEPEVMEKLTRCLDYYVRELVNETERTPEADIPKDIFETFLIHILRSILKIYIHFSGSPEFISFVAEDTRSYNYDIMNNVLRIFNDVRLLTLSEQNTYRALLDKIESQYQRKQREQIDLETDVPEEFIDPITACIMKDPVLLPTSGSIVDRFTIKRHLLNDATDPFNRMALTLEMLVPQPELKQRIEDYIRERTSDSQQKQQQQQKLQQQQQHQNQNQNQDQQQDK